MGIFIEERDALEEETRKIDDCDMEKFGTLDVNINSSYQGINRELSQSIGDRWRPQAAKQEGDT